MLRVEQGVLYVTWYGFPTWYRLTDTGTLVQTCNKTGRAGSRVETGVTEIQNESKFRTGTKRKGQG